MFNTNIDLGQVLILAGGAAAWVGAQYANRAKLEAMAARQDRFEKRVDETLKEHGGVLMSISGQIQRVIGTLSGAPVRHTDPGAGN